MLKNNFNSSHPTDLFFNVFFKCVTVYNIIFLHFLLKLEEHDKKLCLSKRSVGQRRQPKPSSSYSSRMHVVLSLRSQLPRRTRSGRGKRKEKKKKRCWRRLLGLWRREEVVVVVLLHGWCEMQFIKCHALSCCCCCFSSEHDLSFEKRLLLARVSSVDAAFAKGYSAMCNSVC